MSKVILEARKKDLELQLELVVKKFAEISETRRLTLNPGDRVVLDAQIAKLIEDSDEIEKDLKKTKLQLADPADIYRKQALTWEESIPMMDYLKARKIVEE